MRFAFWKHVFAGLMLCGLTAGCGTEQEELQDEKQDVQEAEQELQEEKEDVEQEKRDDPAAGEAGTGGDVAPDPSAAGNGLEPTPSDPDSPAVREEEPESVPKELGDEG